MANAAEGGRPTRGTAEWIPTRTGGGKYVAKITGLDGKRLRMPMVGEDGLPKFTDKARHKLAARRYAQTMYSELRQENASAFETDTKKTPSTVEGFGALWTSGALHREYGDYKRLKLKKSARDDHNRLKKYVYPYIGKSLVAEITEMTVARTMAKAAADFELRNKRPMSQATKRHIYMVMHRLFDLAIKPGGLRKDNPVTDDNLPSPGPQKVYAFLYPTELVKLLGCTEVSLVHRIYYAIGVYTGLRKAALKALTWGSVNFKHASFRSLVSKTDVPQMFSQSDPMIPGLRSLIGLLALYREHLGDPADDRPIIGELRCQDDHEAAQLREDLECAGIKRKELFAKSEKEMPLRFHDLRATFVTWAFRMEKSDSWIEDRTAQITKRIMIRYKRAARSIADLTYEPFPDIARAIPELAQLADQKKRKR
jgi:integrase